MESSEHIVLSEKYGAHNYAPLDVVLSRGKGAWVYDVEGRKYLDMLSAYSAMNFGHSNPRFLRAAARQIKSITLTSRAFYNDQFGLLCRDLAALCRMDAVLLMNTGAEAVETAIKGARKWGYQRKGIAPEAANIVCFTNGFAGRTVTVISFSTQASAREGFGPFTPGFRIVPYGNLDALRDAIDKNTAAVLFEPVQGEGGVIVPPDGFISGLRQICSDNRVLMIADEIQTGLCRTGEIFACDHEQVRPDVYLLGKSLGGGIVPVSAVVADADFMEVFTPGTHGSTFGGNPLACAIAREVLAFIREKQPHKKAARTGKYFLRQLRRLESEKIEAVRGRGLMIGIDVFARFGRAAGFCHALKEHGLLCKDTREQTLRLAPPLLIGRSEIDWAVERLKQVF